MKLPGWFTLRFGGCLFFLIYSLAVAIGWWGSMASGFSLGMTMFWASALVDEIGKYWRDQLNEIQDEIITRQADLLLRYRKEREDGS